MLVKDFLRRRRDYDCSYFRVKSSIVIPSRRRHASRLDPLTLSAVQKNERTAGPLYPIASVDSALRILLMFREQRALRLTDAARTLGVAHSTAHRLLAMLHHHGFVHRDPASRRYVPGPSLVEIGLSAIGTIDLRN